MSETASGQPTQSERARWDRLVELTKESLDGDQQASSDLICTLQPVVRSVLRGLSGLTRADREDIEQDVWEKLTRFLPQVHDPARLDGWVRTVARRQASCWQHKASRIDLVGDEPLCFGLDGPGADDSADDFEHFDHDGFWAAFRRLSMSQQRLLWLDAQGVYRYRDLARILQVPIGSLGPTRRRALDCLERHLVALGVIEAGHRPRCRRSAGAGRRPSSHD